MLYLQTTVTVAYGKVPEFHDFWSKESLPFWEKQGAKHIGSWTTTMGKGSEIVRLFAFESLASYERWESFVFGSPEGQALVRKLSPYLVATDTKLMRPASYSPLQ